MKIALIEFWCKEALFIIVLFIIFTGNPSIYSVHYISMNHLLPCSIPFEFINKLYQYYYYNPSLSQATYNIIIVPPLILFISLYPLFPFLSPIGISSAPSLPPPIYLGSFGNVVVVSLLCFRTHFDSRPLIPFTHPCSLLRASFP